MKTTTKKINELTVKQIEKLNEQGILKHSHTSWRRGYVSRCFDGNAFPYDGRFGRGYVIHRPSWQSTQYSLIEYYLYT